MKRRNIYILRYCYWLVRWIPFVSKHRFLMTLYHFIRTDKDSTDQENAKYNRMLKLVDISGVRGVRRTLSDSSSDRQTVRQKWSATRALCPTETLSGEIHE